MKPWGNPLITRYTEKISWKIVSLTSIRQQLDNTKVTFRMKLIFETFLYKKLGWGENEKIRVKN